MAINIDSTINKLKKVSQRLKDSAQGRVFTVGTQVLYRGKLGIVTKLNQGSEDPTGSTANIRLFDGKVVEKVKVTSKDLKFFRA